MKDLKHIKRFNEAQENLNISDVGDSYFTLEEVKILMNQSYIVGRDNHKIESDLNDMKALMRDFNDKGIDYLIGERLKNRKK